jgi:chloramphenicol-sensitive protein RarD
MSRRHLVPLFASTILITVNWYTFIYAIETNRLLQASLGYFINPLVSVLLGVAVMGERLSRWQLLGLGLAATGVGLLTWFRGDVPWIALILAISFGLYGLMRKTMHVGAVGGLTIETGFLVLPSVVVVAAFSRQHPTALAHQNAGMYALLMLSGIVTSVPLLLFASAARRLRLSTMGFLQYIAPSSQFLLAVFAFGEPFTRWHLISFGLIWSALVIYTAESYLTYRHRGSATIGATAAQAIDDGAEPTA